MKECAYHRVDTVDNACELLYRYGGSARILAGGTDLLIELRREGTQSPAALVDISRTTRLQGIREENGSVEIGSLVTHAEIVRSPLLRDIAPLLSVASATIGSEQIRNRGTIGGNIMNAAACADSIPPLIALDARAHLQSKEGERVVALRDFFVAPYRTAARKDELLVSVSFPPLQPETRSAFLKLGRRNALAIARISVATLLTFDANGLVQDARIVPGSLFPTWQRVEEAERILMGRKPTTALCKEAGEATAACLVRVTGRRWSTEYKEPVVGVLVRRALELCCREERR